MAEKKEDYDVHGVTHEHEVEKVPEIPEEEKLIETGRLAREITVAKVTRCAIKHGDSGMRSDFGGCFSANLRDTIGLGYRCVNVQLAGWYLDYRNKDHHINTISVRFKNIRYNGATGAVTWSVVGCYQDKNGDDDFYWRVWWTISAIG